MSKYQYIIEGTPYDKDIDLVSKLLTLTTKFNLSGKIEKTENGYLIEIEADEKALLDFEPQLFKKLTSLIEIRLYTKKQPKPSKNTTDSNKAFKTCAQLLRQEKIIAIKGKNGFHLVCSASKSKAVLALRALISEPDKPLSVMYKNIQKARHLVLLSSKEEALLKSDKKPFVIAKLRNLHRLEKIKYKHKLTPLINTINQRITLSLPYNELYERLFNEIEFPIVSLDTTMISKDALLQAYGDSLDYILESNNKIEKVKPREVLQIVYGKTQSITAKLQPQQKVFEVYLDYEKSIISNFKFQPFKLLETNQPKYKALSLLFTKLSIEQILKLELPFTDNEIIELHKSWEKSTTTSDSLIDLFDAVASLSGELHEKSFIDHSIMLAENYHEACEEHLFEFKITDNEIEIDVISEYLQNSKLNYLSSTLVNTIATIITQIAKEQDLDVHLSGELFHYKNLSELTIEKLEDEDIKAIL
jgi:hydrogenase maturation factor HypF (carbamoyltransferase family)